MTTEPTPPADAAGGTTVVVPRLIIALARFNERYIAAHPDASAVDGEALHAALMAAINAHVAALDAPRFNRLSAACNQAAAALALRHLWPGRARIAAVLRQFAQDVASGDGDPILPGGRVGDVQLVAEGDVRDEGRRQAPGESAAACLDDELIVPLPNGGTLRCGPGADHLWGGSLRICDPDGRELVFWHADEWSEEFEGESVIGAVFAAALTPLAQLRAERAHMQEDAAAGGEVSRLVFEVVATSVWDAAGIQEVADEFARLYGGNLNVASAALVRVEVIPAPADEAEAGEVPEERIDDEGRREGG